MGWRYDLLLWFMNLQSRGELKQVQRKIMDLAQFQPGEAVLDVGCGTGSMTQLIGQCVGVTGTIYGLDPGPKQIARAQAKANQSGLSITYQVGVIEHLPYPDQSFDVVLSTFMMHVLPDNVKQQGLAEIVRVLKPGGRVIIVDFKRPESSAQPSEKPEHTGPWKSGVQDQPGFLQAAGFSGIESGEIATRSNKLPEIGYAIGSRLI
ncbi:class I SAM-dependent methyltransferase [Tengunoibacter tsumagoiensis]|nr:class I SAM-dependent methyltransferase [Tengunoibacter tsumagoiensis]